MKLAVFFPGIGYRIDKPLLYYTKKLAIQFGYEVVEVSYENFPKDVKNSKEKMQVAFQNAYLQTEEILNNIDFNIYNDILFVSKSIGTAVAAAFAEKHKLNTRNIYFTPVEATFSCIIKNNGIVFHGTKDAWVDTDTVVNGCKEKSLDLYITDQANHSLETGNTLLDIMNLQKVVEVCTAYIGKDK